MARLQYPLPAWVDPNMSLASATEELRQLLNTKPSKAHALRTIIAKIAEVNLDQVPNGERFNKFLAANQGKPMTTWAAANDERSAPAPERPADRFVPRPPHVPRWGPTDEAMAREMMRMVEEMERAQRGKRAAPPEDKPAPVPSGPPPLSRAEIVELIERHLTQHVTDVRHAEREPVTVVVKAPGKAPKMMGVQHEKFPLLLQMVAATGQDGHRLNIWLPGPAGSGKTRAAMEAAKAVGLSFKFCGALDSAYALLGFTDAKGDTVRTQFREAYEHGGVFLFDEVDASDPSAVLALNAALANGHCAFPDAVIERHKDCCIIAAANTWGHGGTFEYVGRMKQDAAFLSRFVVLPWPYDEKLERAISGDEDWAEYVQHVRANVVRHKISIVISPRATTNGAALLAAGLPRDAVIDATLRSGMDDATWARVS